MRAYVKRLVRESKWCSFKKGDVVKKVKQGKNRSSYWERQSDGLIQRVHNNDLKDLDEQ